MNLLEKDYFGLTFRDADNNKVPVCLSACLSTCLSACLSVCDECVICQAELILNKHSDRFEYLQRICCF